MANISTAANTDGLIDKRICCIQLSTVPDKNSSLELFGEAFDNEILQNVKESEEPCSGSSPSTMGTTCDVLGVADDHNRRSGYSKASNAPVENMNTEGFAERSKCPDINKQIFLECRSEFPSNLCDSLGGSLSIDEIEKSCLDSEKMPSILEDSLSDPDVLQNFDPNISSLRSTVVTEVTETASAITNAENEAVPSTIVSHRLNEDNEEEKWVERSKATSPVFEPSKTNRKRTTKKRRSQGSLSLNPLNITFVRKEDSVSSTEDTFRMLNDNFAQKSFKRKEAPSNGGCLSTKKPKAFDKNNIIERRKDAVIEQQNYVNNKDKKDCRQRMGSLMKHKQSKGRKQLKDIASRPQRYSFEEVCCKFEFFSVFLGRGFWI